MSKNEMGDLEFLQFLQALAEHAEVTNDNIVEEGNVVEKSQEQCSERPKPEKSGMGGLHIASIKEAEYLIDTHMHFGHSQIGSKVVAYITDPDNHVCGNPGQYHNLISSYLALGDSYNALQLCQYALAKFPFDIDLLANAIRAASDSGESKIVEKYIADAKSIDKKYWNWRLFLFILDAYQRKMSQCHPDDMDACYNEAMDVAKAYQQYIPLDERSYNKEAELLLMANKVTEARDLLTEKFDRGVLVNGERRQLVAPQCCVTMLDKILEDTHDYDEIIRISRRGIQDTAQEQPSSHIGYFVYRMALALDAQIVGKNYDVQDDTLLNTLRTYQCAYTLNRERTSYMHTIETRYTILAQFVKNPEIVKPLTKTVITDPQKEADE